MVSIKDLLANINEILPRITYSHLSRYDELQRSLLSVNVASDESFQRIFNGFYKMLARPSAWYKFFFSLLEREKYNNGVFFGDILNEIYNQTNRVEPSFTSKLIATICPDKPTYDKHVRINLCLSIPRPDELSRTRIRKFISTYSQLEDKTCKLLSHCDFTTLKEQFDNKFSMYSHFTNTKKLDFILWQYRQPD